MVPGENRVLVRQGGTRAAWTKRGVLSLGDERLALADKGSAAPPDGQNTAGFVFGGFAKVVLWVAVACMFVPCFLVYF